MLRLCHLSSSSSQQSSKHVQITCTSSHIAAQSEIMRSTNSVSRLTSDHGHNCHSGCASQGEQNRANATMVMLVPKLVQQMDSRELCCGLTMLIPFTKATRYLPCECWTEPPDSGRTIPPIPRCVPGSTRSCRCTNGLTGAQVLNNFSTQSPLTSLLCFNGLACDRNVSKASHLPHACALQYHPCHQDLRQSHRFHCACPDQQKAAPAPTASPVPRCLAVTKFLINWITLLLFYMPFVCLRSVWAASRTPHVCARRH